MESLEQVLVESINKFNGAVDKGVDFALEQAPDVIQQLLMWKSISSLIVFCLGVMLLVATVIYAVITIKQIKKTKPEKGEQVDNVYWRGFYNFEPSLSDYAAWGFPLIALSSTLVSLIILLENLAWLKIWIAPKLYLLEYAASLIK